MPGVPKNFAEFKENLPESLQTTNFEGDNEDPSKRFVLFNDYVGGGKKGKKEYAVTFVSNAGIEGLIKFPTWVMDGTFETAPKNPKFKQIFVIVGVDHEQRSFPLVWCFLSHKTPLCYRNGVLIPLHNAIVQHIVASGMDISKMHPKICVTDFELAISNSIKEVFSTFTVYGCLFHWKHAIKSRVDKIGLASFYISKTSSGNGFREFVAMVMALTYVHPHCVPHYFNALAMYVRKKMANKLSLWYKQKQKVGFFFGPNVSLYNGTSFRSRSCSPTCRTPGSATRTVTSSRGTPSPTGPATGA